MRSIFTSVLILLATAGIASAAPTARDAWIRLVPGQENASAYVSLTTTADDALVSVESNCCSSVEIHEMSMDGDVMQMRQVKEVKLPAGKTVTLAPMGFHIMLIGLDDAPENGSALPLTLNYASGFSQKVAFTVKLVGAQAQDHGGHH